MRADTTDSIVTTLIGRAGKSISSVKFAHMNRREKLEAMLAASPEDTFLRYALALAWAAEGNPTGARDQLSGLLDDDPHYVPAYFQLAQLQVQMGEPALARPVLSRGIEMARRAGDSHAEGEMCGLLDQLPE
jgi:thioredoxin-like negative regulator of GroEL